MDGQAPSVAGGHTKLIYGFTVNDAWNTVYMYGREQHKTTPVTPDYAFITYLCDDGGLYNGWY